MNLKPKWETMRTRSKIIVLICLLGWTYAFSPSNTAKHGFFTPPHVLLGAEKETIEREINTETETARNEKKNGEENELVEALMGAAIEGAKDLFVALRWTAASALTASLSDNERRELLARTDIGKPDVMKSETDSNEDRMSLKGRSSVNEYIAAAVAAESQRDRGKWEREKELILKQAEEAANRRVQTDLAIQKQRMEQESLRLRAEAEAAKLQFKDVQNTLKVKQEQEAKEEKALQVAREELEKSAAKEKEQLVAMETALHEKEQQTLKEKEKVEGLVQELKAVMERAQKEAEKARNEKKPVKVIHAGRYTPEEYRALSAEEKEMVKALREINKDTDNTSIKEDPDTTGNDVHPVLGPVVSDLGYKRIHLASAGSLGTIPVWKKQRTYRHTRAKAMVADKLKTTHLGIPGVICLHEDKNGKLSILDGQHRVGMMMLLREKQKKQREAATADSMLSKHIDLDRVLVEVYPHQPNGGNTDLAEEMFLEINKAEPIKLVDMPGVAKAKDRNAITGAVERLENQYPRMFSPSQRCRVPNVNVDNLRNNLFGANVIKRHNLTTTTQLLDWILAQNIMLGEKYEGDEEAQGWINPKAWKKASDNHFYLGLDSTWLYN